MKNKFPTYEETINHINALNKVVWKEYDGSMLDEYISENHKLITDITTVHPTILLHTPIEFPFDFSFFRVRKLSDIKNQGLRSEYSYPPACFSNENLRANLKGHPVFYSADHPVVALLEYIGKWDNKETYTNTTYAISKWKLKKGKRYFIAPFIQESLDYKNEYSALAKFTNAEMRKLDNELTESQINGMRAMKNYLASLFITDEKRTISSYLGHHNLYRNPVKPPIFVYPSVKAEKGENNYALHPNFVDENLSLERVWMMQLNNINQNKAEFNFNFTMMGEFGFNHNDYIRWKSFKKHKEQVEEYFLKDFGFSLNMK